MDLFSGKDSVVAEFDFRPRCLQNYKDVLVTGGLHEDHGVGGSQKGLLAVHNMVTGDQVSRDLGDLINNSVCLYSDTNDKIDAIVCNNDCSLYFLEIMDSQCVVSDSMRLDTPFNHASISPDHKTVVACGDNPNIIICNRKGTSGWTMSDNLNSGSDSGFSTAWHSSGILFGVAFQDGTARLYDIRNLKQPLTEIKSSCPEMAGAFRCIKFSNGCEDMLFLTEQVERVHVVDIRDFDNHQVLTVPLDPCPFSSSVSSESYSLECDDELGSQQNNLPGSIIECDSVVRPYDQFMVDSSPPNLSTRSALSHSSLTSSYNSGAASTSSGPYGAWMDTSRYPNSNYDQSLSGISGLAWSQHLGGSLIVGTHNSIGVWKVDGWTRRTFPSYTIR